MRLSKRKWYVLAVVCLKKKIITWYEIEEYARRYKKYDNWTLRDFDETKKIVDRVKIRIYY